MQKKTHGFTLVELLVVIGIIALLISMLLPALSKVRQQALLTACSAKLHDLGMAVSEYTIANHDYYPGPCFGQVRAGYIKDSHQLGEYIAKFMRLPDATTDWQVCESLLCPGYRASNPGIVPEGELWTYELVMWDPYPWFGYADTVNSTKPGYFPMYAKLRPSPTSGTLAGTVLPMKTSQMFKASEMPMVADSDNAAVIFISGVSQGAPGSEQNNSISKVPNHGGKAETHQGIEYFDTNPKGGGGPFLRWKDKTASTNAPRNYLFFDGHVQTLRKSGIYLPPDLTSKWGPVPSGWTPPYYN